MFTHAIQTLDNTKGFFLVKIRKDLTITRQLLKLTNANAPSGGTLFLSSVGLQPHTFQNSSLCGHTSQCPHMNLTVCQPKTKVKLENVIHTSHSLTCWPSLNAFCMSYRYNDIPSHYNKIWKCIHLRYRVENSFQCADIIGTKLKIKLEILWNITLFNFQ